MSLWLGLVLSLAALKIALGVAGFFYSVLGPVPAGPESVPSGFSLAHLLVYASVGVLLVWNRARDRRALFLGSAFLLVAVAPSDRLFASLAGAAPPLGGAIAVLSHLHPDAFLPLCFWLFFGSFPRTLFSDGARLIRRTGITVSALGGVLLFAVHASPILASGPFSDLAPYLAPVQPSPALYLYTWTFLIALAVPSLGFSVTRIRWAPIPERRRAGLFLAGIVAGSVPFWITILSRAISPTIRSWLDDPAHGWVGLYVVRLAAMSIPVTTAYAVLVHQVLDVKLVVRQAIRYALARYAVLGATAVPFAALVAYVYRNRNATISELLSGTGPLILLFATGAGLVTLQLRQSVLAAIDRHFFREHYDARRILMSLVEGSRRAASPRELADLLCAEIDRALHLDRVSVFVLDSARGALVDRQRGSSPVLSASPLATLVSAQEEPLDIDWDRERSPLMRLSEAEREWLAGSRFRLLVPLIASDGTLVGIAALGVKKSELPFSREDRLLLSTIAASAALTLENRIKVSSPGDWPRPGDDGATAGEAPELAMECERCGRVAPPDAGRCRDCEGELGKASIPYVLMSKFRVERRIGSGGMGVVYQAMDVTLGRRVAIKTLPRLSMEFASRLRREARAMAAVTHENLALVYGVETWLGAPLLVVELLEGGTLASRLRAGKLDLVSALDLGITLAGVLDTMHTAGVLHRDIKPSNVGYTASGVVKLLDFGLAKILDDSRALTQAQLSYEDLGEVPQDALTVLTVTRTVVGTPIYLSPEAARGLDPDPRVDLWAFAVLLFEAVAGTHPLRVHETAGLRRRIFEGEVTDLRTVLDPCPEPLARFFGAALARDWTERPATAAEIRDRLHAARAELVSSGSS